MEEAQKQHGGFKVKKHVVKQLFKVKPGVEYYFLIAGPMHLGKKVEDNKDPATLADVIQLDTGEIGQIICPKLVRDALNEQYPGDGYIGKAFAIELMRVPDKRYNLLKTFVEIEPSEAPKQAAPVSTMSEREKDDTAHAETMRAGREAQKAGRK